MPAFPMRTAETMIMKMVMPDTGSFPVKAMELMPTTDKRNEKMRIIAPASRVWVRLWEQVTWKKRVNNASMARVPVTIWLMGRSCWVRRSPAVEDGPDVHKSEAARRMTRPTTPDMETRPMMPAMASMPMPMWRTYWEKTASIGASAKRTAWPWRVMTCSPPR